METKHESASSTVHEGHRHRLRERFRQAGLEDFAPHEVMELLLTYAIPRRDVNADAHALIDRFGSVAGVLDATPEELCEVDGIGEQAVLLLKLIPAVLRRYNTDKCNLGEPMDTVAKLGAYLHARYTGVTHERVYLLLFDNAMRLIDCCHIGDGAVNCANVTVRRIAELAFAKHAACAVLAHNHPRGLAIPSGSDCEITEVISNALDILGIPLLEHLIVTENSYSPILRRQKGTLRASPITGHLDEGFYRHFYGDTSADTRL